jgi:DNA repair exonuclease SbcCD ATPase subunit
MKPITTKARLHALEERAERQHQRLADVERELTRLSPQVAALEQRLEDLRQHLETPDLDASDPDRAEARTLLQEIRREHAQIRARITAATVFEERLRVLEAQARVDSATGRPLPPRL